MTEQENNKSWILYGPKACGKTTHAHEIANALGMSHIEDDWMENRYGTNFKPHDTLHISFELPKSNRLRGYPNVISYQAAMKLVSSADT